MTRRSWLGVVAVAALVLLAVWAARGLWWRPAERSAPDATAAPTASGPARSLLLVTIDTLRADRVGIYGHADARTPAFDAIARAGVRFDRAFAPAPITLPSHASLLTGLNPPGHDARHNGMKTRDTVPTLASVLAERNFGTAAFVSAFPLDRRFGLERGFAVYDDRMPRGRDGRPLNERPGARTVDAALAWLAQHRSSRFFLWVHLFEPHAPYGDPSNPGLAGLPTLSRYDAEIAEADRQVARLVDALGEERASTLVVITSDHGEAFGEHGEVTHSLFVYDTTLRVPLAMSGPGVPADGRVVGVPAGLIDLAPTLLALLGAPPLDADGIDLRTVMTSPGGAASARPLYAESMAPLLDFGWSPLRSVREGAWKYIDAPRAELYDVVADPGEAQNLATEHPGESARLADRAGRLGPWTTPTEDAADAEAASRLGSLGYVRAGRAASAGPRIDPKERRAVASRLARIASGEVSPDRLVGMLEDVLREDAGNPQAHLRLGVALAEQGDCVRAEPHLREAIAADMPTADPYISLAFCQRTRRDPDGARQTLLRARRVEPGNPIVEANLGLLALDAGRLEEATTALRGALAIDADLHEARFALARALARDGQRDAAREQAALLLERLPPDAPQRGEVERLVAALR